MFGAVFGQRFAICSRPSRRVGPDPADNSRLFLRGVFHQSWLPLYEDRSLAISLLELCGNIACMVCGAEALFIPNLSMSLYLSFRYTVGRGIARHRNSVCSRRGTRRSRLYVRRGRIHSAEYLWFEAHCSNPFFNSSMPADLNRDV